MNISTNEYNILNLPTTPDNSRLSLFSSWSGPYDKLGQSVTSSITSWSDGFEGETTKRLGQHIEHVQNSLYEPQEHFSHSKNLNLSEWKIFPHLSAISEIQITLIRTPTEYQITKKYAFLKKANCTSYFQGYWSWY
uniref:Uncharacterized protein n=1 Tax=Clastoptera arizonana TaxID=38151 RepID=A0A1B6CN25_9HEMI